jgi:hypothetical protein
MSTFRRARDETINHRGDGGRLPRRTSRVFLERAVLSIHAMRWRHANAGLNFFAS